MAEQADIDMLFRQAQERRTAEPPAMAWDRISESLDVEDTWKRISATLDARAAKRRRFAILLSSFFITALIAGCCTWLLYLNGQTKNDSYAKNTVHAATNKPGNKTSPHNSEEKNPGAAPVAKADQKHPATQSAANNKIPQNQPGTSPVIPAITARQTSGGSSSSNDISVTSSSFHTTPETESPFFAPALPLALLKNTAEEGTEELPALDDENEIQETRPLRFSAEIFGGRRAHWLVDKGDFGFATGDTLRTGQSSHAFSSVAGMRFGYQLRPRLSLQASLYLLSGGGQVFVQEDSTGKSADELRLNYSSLGLNAGIKTGRTHYTRWFTTYGTCFAGIHFSQLRGYNELASVSRSIRAENSYRNFDIGITAGYAQHFCFGRRFTLIPSIGWQQGLLNISKRPDKLPSAISRAYNGALDAQLGLRFSF